MIFICITIIFLFYLIIKISATILLLIIRKISQSNIENRKIKMYKNENIYRYQRISNRIRRFDIKNFAETRSFKFYIQMNRTLGLFLFNSIQVNFLLITYKKIPENPDFCTRS